MLHKIGIALLGIYTTSCAPEDVRIVQSADFIESTRSISTFTTNTSVGPLDIKVYGLTGARAATLEESWDGVVVVRLLNSRGHLQRPRFPWSQHTFLIDNTQYENDAGTIDEVVNRISEAQGVPTVFLGPPGLFGSQGRYRYFFQPIGAEAINEAITLIKQELGAREIIVAGASASGLLVAGLLTHRSDIRCAIIASSPLDLNAYASVTPVFSEYLGRFDIWSPLEHVEAVNFDNSRTIFVGYSSNDEIVPHESSLRYARALENLGHTVSIEEAQPHDPWGHDITAWLWQKIIFCRRDL